MSFRLQLLLLGLAVLAYLGARWWWLERMAASQQTSGLEPQPTDPITERVEPLFTDAIADVPLTKEPAMSDLASTLDRRPVLHSQIDCIALLELDEPVQGDVALSLIPATRRIGSKTWRVEGFNAQAQAWESLHTGQAYERFQAGIQLVNRHGALNDVEFSEFVAKASHFAEGVGATPDFPDMMTEVARAKELEQFTMAHDIRLSLHLQAKRAPWSLPYVQQHAKRVGCVAGVIPGRWVLGSTTQHEMIALTIDPQAAMADEVSPIPIQKISLRLDVPQVARGDEQIGHPFDTLCDVAIRLSAGMEALIVDEQGLVVDLEALKRTAAELEEVYDRLDRAGLSAGSVLAKRLFS